MSRNNCLLSKDGTKLILGCKTSVIPNCVTYIGYNAFSGCSGLQSIEIPNSVTRIGDSAFVNCSSLQSIEIPNSVTYIGYNAFSGCSGLSSLTIHYDNLNNISPMIVNNLPISDKITLHVPIGTGYAYRHHPVFSKVKEVIADVR